ncbi:MAG: hypothetical protein HYU04_01060 [Candidatus Wildermuthbacteria bacterium]|nr:hypothetical protein [Candidatus Wildermuthbacteria bacterium]
MVSPKLKDELGDILKEDYEIVLSPSEIEQIANNLVSYFDLLKKIYHREEKSINKDEKETVKVLYG